MVFVLTGFRSKELKDYVLASGGAVSENVTKATTAVIALDVAAKSGKIDDAKRLGVPVVSLDAVWNRSVLSVDSLTPPKPQ